MKTRDRILATSLQLFNRQGERSVSTNHIAAELGISPGNLYYHVANKEAIIAALFGQYSDEMRQILRAPADRLLTMDDKLVLFEAILDCMWRYRFLHRDLVHLVSDSETLRERYRAFAADLMHAAHSIYRVQAAHEQMLLSEADISALVVNLWIIATGWVSFVTSTGFFGDDEPLTEERLRQGIYQILCLEAPYVQQAVRPQFEALKSRYGKPLRLSQPLVTG